MREIEIKRRLPLKLPLKAYLKRVLMGNRLQNGRVYLEGGFDLNILYNLPMKKSHDKSDKLDVSHPPLSLKNWPRSRRSRSRGLRALLIPSWLSPRRAITPCTTSSTNSMSSRSSRIIIYPSLIPRICRPPATPNHLQPPRCPASIRPARPTAMRMSSHRSHKIQSLTTQK